MSVDKYTSALRPFDFGDNTSTIIDLISTVNFKFMRILVIFPE